MGRATIVVVGLLLLAAILGSVGWLGVCAWRRIREGRFFAAGLAILVAAVLLAPAVLVVDMIGFALFWQS